MLQGYLLFSLAISLIILAVDAQVDLEDLDDLITAESNSKETTQSRNARFLKMPALFKRKIRIKKRIGPLDPARPPFNPSVPRQRLHMKRPQPVVKRPVPPAPVAKYPKVGKMGRLGPVPPPQPVPARPSALRPKQQKRPVAPRPVKKLPSRHLNKKQLHSKEPIFNDIRPQGPQRILKKPIADERFFFGNRGRRRPRPQYKKKKPKRRPHKRPAKRPKVQKPKAPKKQTTYKTTTKAPAYKPPATEPTYEVEVTSYKPSEEVYQPSHNVDEFPDFPEPDFPDFMASFMPDFNFDINKINCKCISFYVFFSIQCHLIL